MNREVITWSEVMKLPSPDWILTVFWQVIIYYWQAEMDHTFYCTNKFPISVSDVRLQVDHKMHSKVRYHIYRINKDETAGVWDETPFWIDFSEIDPQSVSIQFIEHGDYRHSFQLFVKSFMKSIRKYIKFYPELDLAYRVISKMPILTWRCSVCHKYDIWARDFIEEELIEHDISISSSTLMFLLSYKNKKLMIKNKKSCIDSCDMLDIMKKALHRFFIDFEKIYEQTSMNPTIILQNLLDILEKYDCSINEIQEIEQACAKDMKCYLYNQFKFLRTKSIGISHFPRDLMIARDIIPEILGESPPSSDSSPGILMLMNYLVFKDHALLKKGYDDILVVNHDSCDSHTIRHITPPEMDKLSDYHPLLRSSVFLDE